MATQEFIVKNGLKAGPLTIDASTGSISTTGNVTVTAPGTINVDSIGVDSIAKNNSSVTIVDTGATGSSVTFEVDGVDTASATNGGFNVLNGDLSVSNNAIITGDLTVNGTTTTVDTANMLITDPLLVLAKDTSGSPIADGGFVIERGTSTNVAFMWDESDDQFTVVNTTEDGTTSGNVTIDSYANFKANNITASGFSGPVTGDVTGNVSGTSGSWANSRTITLGGDLSGNVSFDGSANATLNATITSISGDSSDITDWDEAVQDSASTMMTGGSHTGIAVSYDDGAGTVALSLTADPTVTLTGDVTGAGTMTNLGSVSITTTVADNSHSHNTQYYTKALGDARYLLDSSYTAADVLAKIKTVDGTGSGLDADTLDGNSSAYFAPQSDTYTKAQVDSSISAVLTDIDWKEAVTNFADLATTYTSPVEGWTASVNSEDTVYRYDGSSWIVLANGTVPLASGAVDGKMTSSDFTKLSGIESAATADQSAAEILAALLTVDGAGSGLDADTLDGNSSAYFAPQSDTYTKAAGDARYVLDSAYTAADVLAKLLTVDGASSGLDADTVDGISSGSFVRSDANDNVTGHTEWQDNYEVRCGNGADLRLLHNGSSSYIQNYTGNLFIDQNKDGGYTYLRVQDSGGTTRNMIRAGGSTPEVLLMHNGNTKLTTTATGVTVAGTMNGTATAAQYADVAEKYVADAQYEPGTVLAFGGEFEVTADAEDGSSRQAGVVSTNPALIMNNGLAGEFVVEVAFTGRVPCKVKGPVAKGDMMVAAGNGFARAEANPSVGAVIGKALEAFDGAEGVIEVVIR